MRCGDSNATMVSRRSAHSSSARRRAPGLTGRNPTNVNASVGSPLTCSAAITALGPGMLSMRTPSATAARTSGKPGSAMPGEPASVTTAMDSPPRNRSTSPEICARSLCSNRLTSARANPEVIEQPAGVARVLGGDQAHLAQHAQRALGDVLEVADGRRHQVQRASVAGGMGVGQCQILPPAGKPAAKKRAET